MTRRTGTFRVHAAMIACVAVVALAVPAASAQGSGECVNGLTMHVDQDAERVTLTWEPVPGAEFHAIHRAINDFVFHEAARVGGDEGTFVDENVPGGVVAYRVAADGPPGEECEAVVTHVHGGGAPPGAECVTTLTATAREDASILLDWDAVPDADAYHVVRATGDGSLAPRAVVTDATEFVDEDVTAGVTYRYAVAADGPAEDCPPVEAIAVPFLPGGMTVAVAAAVGLAAVVGSALARRR